MRQAGTAVSVIAYLMLFVAACAYGGETPAAKLDGFAAGERMYRQGILPSGEPMRAVVKGDIPVDGTTFTCVSCHLRSGIGSIEGGVVTPPTNGKSVFSPLKLLYKGVEVSTAPPIRPAYTEESLALLLRTGVNPNGRTINEVMPRYLLEETDMSVLISYIKKLSPEFSPGYSNGKLKFATVITEGVRPADKDEMLATLEGFITSKNNLAKSFRERPKSARMAETMVPSRETIYVTLSLSKWFLKGPPAGWRGQLEEYYKKEPVFALIGGISDSEWRPVHEFCEEKKLPCIFPLTDFPVISDSDWYTLYISKGYYQEGEAAARYINSATEDGKLLQVVRDTREGRALSEGFTKTLVEINHAPAVTVTLAAGDKLTAQSLRKLVEKEHLSAVVVWDGPGALPAVEGLAGMKDGPSIVIASSVLMGKGLYSLKDTARDYMLFTYPYRLPKDEDRIFRTFKDPFLKYIPGAQDEHRISGRAVAAVRVLSQALMDMRGNYFRDSILDAVGMSADQQFPVYERMSFGPAQRYSSKGCYILQLTKGEKPELVKKSEWVIH